jgi:hypothetical protein
VSIYATYWTLRFEDPDEDEWHEITAQAVPAHIGSPEEYPEGDPFGAYLPPPVSANSPYPRAVVLVTEDTKKGTERSGQEYVDPLLVLSGKEYVEASFADLLERIGDELRKKKLWTGKELLQDAARHADAFTREDFDRMLQDLGQETAKAPSPVERAMLEAAVRGPLPPDVIGCWPGDETDEELLAALAEADGKRECEECGRLQIELIAALERSETLAERVRELESLPKERKCRECERMFTVDVDHPRRLLCDVCFLAVIEKVCPDCGGDDASHRDTCPRSPTVRALAQLVADLEEACEDHEKTGGEQLVSTYRIRAALRKVGPPYHTEEE